MRTVELPLGAALDATVRRLWQQLHHAGLRSLATHTSATNRPHITLATAESVAALPRLRLPIPVRVGAVRPLGRALVCQADSEELRSAQSAVWAAVEGTNPLHAPDVWVPHVSLALNMPESQQATALRLLADLPPMSGRCVTVRSFDTVSRTVTDLDQ